MTKCPIDCMPKLVKCTACDLFLSWLENKANQRLARALRRTEKNDI